MQKKKQKLSSVTSMEVQNKKHGDTGEASLLIRTEGSALAFLGKGQKHRIYVKMLKQI